MVGHTAACTARSAGSHLPPPAVRCALPQIALSLSDSKMKIRQMEETVAKVGDSQCNRPRRSRLLLHAALAELKSQCRRRAEALACLPLMHRLSCLPAYCSNFGRLPAYLLAPTSAACLRKRVQIREEYDQMRAENIELRKAMEALQGIEAWGRDVEQLEMVGGTRLAARCVAAWTAVAFSSPHPQVPC